MRFTGFTKAAVIKPLWRVCRSYIFFRSSISGRLSRHHFAACLGKPRIETYPRAIVCCAENCRRHFFITKLNYMLFYAFPTFGGSPSACSSKVTLKFFIGEGKEKVFKMDQQLFERLCLPIQGDDGSHEALSN